jgi:RNA polymerase sigma-70 factor (ECF subfamily)
VQETSLRAWKALTDSSREPVSCLRIGSRRTCSRTIERRARAPEALDPGEIEIARYFQPYPDRLLSADATVEERESLGLAFVSVVQLLPPRQRAVLVLRDVLEWSAQEVADLLGDSVASVNSALQRAREARARADRGRLAREHAPASVEAETRVVQRFLAAWDAVDVDGLVALLADDAVMTMRRSRCDSWGRKRSGISFDGSGLFERIRLVPTRANGQPAVAATEDEAGAFEAYGVMVLALVGEQVVSITGFAGYPQLFPELGLPLSLDA